MSTKLCERCKRRIKAEAVNCICGWSLQSSRPRMPEPLPEPLPSWGESRAAFNKERDRFARALEPRVWTRETFIEHYQKIIANPDAAQFAKNHAQEALRNLGHSRRAVRERQPGEDLEEALADAMEP